MGDCEAVVDDGNALRRGAGETRLHLFFVEHTAAAVDDQPDARKILRKLAAGGEPELRGCAGERADPRGELFGADVAALAVMGAALGDEHDVSVPERFKRLCPGELLSEAALVAREEDRKRRQRHKLRYLRRDAGERRNAVAHLRGAGDAVE